MRSLCSLSSWEYKSYHVSLALADNDAIWYQRLRNGLTPKPHSSELKFKGLLPVFEVYGISVFISMSVFVVEKIFHSMYEKLKSYKVVNCLKAMNMK